MSRDWPSESSVSTVVASLANQIEEFSFTSIDFVSPSINEKRVAFV